MQFKHKCLNHLRECQISSPYKHNNTLLDVFFDVFSVSQLYYELR